MPVAIVVPSASSQETPAPVSVPKPAVDANTPVKLMPRLKANVACIEPGAGNQLLINADGLGASLPDLLSALDALSLDPATCAQIRKAAASLAQQLSESNPGLNAEQAAEAAERMQQVLIEADQRAASMRFEVGPPPRNLTRNRETFQ